MGDDRSNAETLRRLEAAIEDAGRYVRPSDDLRPRTLEAARERAVRMRGQRRVFAAAATVILAATVGLPSWWASGPASRSGGTSVLAAVELQRQTFEHALARSVDPTWGLYEAFLELRRAQAARMGAGQTGLDDEQ